MFDNDVVRNEHDIIISAKMQNFQFFQFFDETVFKFEQFDNNKFKNNKNEYKNKKYIVKSIRC